MKMDETIKIKQELYSECLTYVESKIEQITLAVDELQKASKLETKSSMGDKYETGRASIQLEMDKYAHQLNEFAGMKRVLFQISVDKEYQTVQPGCVVRTNHINYFIAINAGEFEITGTKYLTISLASPLGKELFKRSTGDVFTFRNKDFKITFVG